jgi:lipoate---protein ligase
MKVRTSRLETMPIEMALALEEICFSKVKKDRTPILRFWRAIPRALTIGRFQCLRGEVDLEYAEDLGIPVVRRMSGGGAVFNDGAGEFAFSVTAPTELLPGGITGSYRTVLEWVNGPLRDLGLDTYIDGTSIFVKDLGKVSGSSMRWNWDTVQVHGTMLHSMDPDLMKRLLWGGRFGCADGTPSIRKEVAPVGDLLDISLPSLHEAIEPSLLPGIERVPLSFDDEEIDIARKIASDKYSNEPWNRKL